MSSIFTKNFNVVLANKFHDFVDVGANSYLPDSKKVYNYIILGRQLPWNDGVEIPPDPPSINDSDLNECFRHGIYAKQIKYENSAMVVKRNDWISGTIYDAYPTIENQNFYVVNSDLQVFKCLYNNNSSASTDEPRLSLSSTSLDEPYLLTSDGYKWKYLYTISTQQKKRFMDENWIPVYNNNFVVDAAVPGGIDIVKITNSGNNYFNGATQSIITVDGDGTGAVLKANVVSGQIQDIVIQERGINYTEASLTFRDVTGGSGTSAAAEVVISPVLGHGSDPIYELIASNVMLNIDFDGDENGFFPTNNDYREAFVVMNPQEYGTTNLATNDHYELYTKIKTSPGLGDFNVDEQIFQGDSFEQSTFSADVISFNEITNMLYVNNVRGTLQLNQAIKGVTTGAIRIATAVTDPTMKLYSGKVLYISDKTRVSRNNNQTDIIRLILNF